MADSHKEPDSKQNSVTKASALQKVFSGVRKPIGVRVDTGLYSAVKPVLIDKYGSVCRPVEAFFVAHLAIVADPASTSHTIRIKNLRIERNLRARRYLKVENEVEPHDLPQKSVVCIYTDCFELATFRDVTSNRPSRTIYTCPTHHMNAVKRGLIKKSFRLATGAVGLSE